MYFVMQCCDKNFNESMGSAALTTPTYQAATINSKHVSLKRCRTAQMAYQEDLYCSEQVQVCGKSVCQVEADANGPATLRPEVSRDHKVGATSCSNNMHDIMCMISMQSSISSGAIWHFPLSFQLILFQWSFMMLIVLPPTLSPIKQG